LGSFFVVLGLMGCENKTDITDNLIQETSPAMVVYKDPNCGCCGKWVEHMEQVGFDLQINQGGDLNAIKKQFGIQPQYQSCHTLLDRNTGYVFEGHIPASVIERFLKEKPQNAIGLSVPGMPIGSPGMEMGDRFDDYDVLLLKTSGETEIYERISGATSAAINSVR